MKRPPRAKQKQRRKQPQPRNQQGPREPRGQVYQRRTTIWRAIEIAAALAGLFASGYLVFDLFYQAATPDIEVSHSESNSPFALPFSVKTQSIIFTMHKTSFICSFDGIIGNNVYNNLTAQFGGAIEIDRRNPGNYFCRNSIPAAAIAKLAVKISPAYYTNILWLYSWERHPERSIFTWVKTGATGYWVKGEIAN